MFESIGHSIIRSAHAAKVSCNPNTLFGTGVESDHVFGSRWLTCKRKVTVRFLHQFIYDEVNRYKQSVIQSKALAYRVLSWTMVHLAVACR